MSEETAKKSGNSMSSVLFGTSVILWILTVFLILQIYKVNQTLTDLLETQRQNFSVFSSQSPGNYEIHDSEGNLVYTIEMKEQLDMDGMMMDGTMDGMMPGEGGPDGPTPADQPPADPAAGTE